MCMETPCFESTRMKEDMDSLINDPSMVSTCNVCVISFLGRNRLGVNIQNNCRNFADCGLRTADCGLHFEKESFLGDYGISHIYSRCIVDYGVDGPRQEPWVIFFLFQIFFQFLLVFAHG